MSQGGIRFDSKELTQMSDASGIEAGDWTKDKIYVSLPFPIKKTLYSNLLKNMYCILHGLNKMPF